MARGSTPAQLAAARAQASAYVSQGRAVEKVARSQRATRVAAQRAAQQTSQRKRATRVQLSAQRKRTGTDRPILVKRREAVATLRKRYEAAPVTPVAERQIKAEGKVKLRGPQALTSKPSQRERKVQQGNIERQAKSPQALFATDPKVLEKAGFKKAGLADKLAAAPLTALGHAPADIAELAVTTPSSIAKLATTAATHPKKLPGMIAEPYKQFAKDPLKFATDKPVSTALMFAPAVKVPLRGAGAVARATGKQTLARPTATFEGTTIKQARVGSREIIKRARQAREDKARPAPKVSHDEVRRRVDEFYDASKYHRARAEASATKKAKQRFAHLPKDERKLAIAEHVSGAKAGALQEVERRFAREFGSHWQVGEKGTILKPKQAAEGHLHDSIADAKRVADRVPFDAVVREAGPGKHAVVPEIAHARLASHHGVERSKSLGGKLLKTSSRSFRGTVLPLSGKWLAGQVVEAGFRSAIKGAGPTSLLRTRRVVKTMREMEAAGKIPKGSAQALLDRAAAGGQFGKGGVLRHELDQKSTLAEEFAGHKGWETIAQGLTKVGQAPGAKHFRERVWHPYQRIVFDTVNGAIERTAQKAMLGKAIKESPLMEKRLFGLSDKAIKEAADGLKGTHSQVELGRAVDRAYGRYSKFGPDRREMLAHNTPFLPWYLNTAHFLLRVLPEDHPIHASLLASTNVATEEWRKANRVSLRGKRVPPFLLGTYPLGHARYRQVGRYLPFSPGSPTEAIGSLLWPQISGAKEAFAPGVTWKGEQIKGGEGGRWREAALSLAEAHIPGFALGTRATGLSETLRGEKKKAAITKERGVVENLKRSLSPLTPVEAKEKGKGGKRRPSGGGGGYPGFGGGASGGSGYPGF